MWASEWEPTRFPSSAAVRAGICVDMKDPRVARRVVPIPWANINGQYCDKTESSYFSADWDEYKPKFMAPRNELRKRGVDMTEVDRIQRQLVAMDDKYICGTSNQCCGRFQLIAILTCTWPCTCPFQIAWDVPTLATFADHLVSVNAAYDKREAAGDHTVRWRWVLVAPVELNSMCGDRFRSVLFDWSIGVALPDSHFDESWVPLPSIGPATAATDEPYSPLMLRGTDTATAAATSDDGKDVTARDATKMVRRALSTAVTATAADNTGTDTASSTGAVAAVSFVKPSK